MKHIKRLMIFLFTIAIILLSYSYFYIPTSSNYSLDYSLKSQIEARTPNYVEINDVPSDLINATLAIEDKRYYKHCGFDVLAILRATLIDIKEKHFVQGGSTITQQLAKNLFLEQQKTVQRKFNEIILSRKLERMFTKDEILEMYLNVIYYGAGAYGIDAASQTYFSKNVTELNLEECAMLAGLPQAPSIYNPKKHMNRARARQKMVFSVMSKNGYLN
ncbi:MAG: transglycosylase domain-containing protein [Vallitalea sp.]|jgi:penicillin-binding protein 1A/penicillin-binding protein 2A|nr:transglycosylase domain-containing protein [Vallitalea sp.]